MISNSPAANMDSRQIYTGSSGFRICRLGNKFTYPTETSKAISDLRLYKRMINPYTVDSQGYEFHSGIYMLQSSLIMIFSNYTNE